MDRAGFLELERDFIGDRQTRAAPEHEDGVLTLDRVGQRAPVAGERALQMARQAPERGVQFLIVGPIGERAQSRDRRVDEGLRGGDALLGAGEDVDAVIGADGERRAGGVGEGKAGRAVASRRGEHGHDIRAFAGLRNREAGRLSQLEPRPVKRGERGAERGDGNAGGQFDCGFDVSASVIGGAARHRHDQTGIEAGERLSGLAHLPVRLIEQPGDGVRNLLHLAAHVGLIGQGSSP